MASAAGIGIANELFQLEIRVPKTFPGIMPSVRELAGRIPKTFHKLQDGSLCLGSPLKLRVMLRAVPTLAKAEKAIGRDRIGAHGAKPRIEHPFRKLSLKDDVITGHQRVSPKTGA
ncbi:MAG TPA: hypothetical protein VNH18_05520 [Bryobacteraceae bacterium]|nr:hypothetical protein [Bryobacteraceae bacterium]